MIDRGGPPWAGVLSSVKKQTEQAMRSKPVAAPLQGLCNGTSLQVAALAGFLASFSDEQ